MPKITGVHHFAIKLCGEDAFLRAVSFYRDTLGLTEYRRWGEGDRSGAMFRMGGSVVEMIANAPDAPDAGALRHIALATDDVDECVKAVREAGYPILIEPKDIEIPSVPPVRARIAFCKGPAGEEIEFFDEK